MALPTLLQDLVLAALPDGGQRVARRKAWAGMSADATRGRARREAEEALSTAAGSGAACWPGEELHRPG